MPSLYLTSLQRPCCLETNDPCPNLEIQAKSWASKVSPTAFKTSTKLSCQASTAAGVGWLEPGFLVPAWIYLASFTGK